nr:MAG TPA: hypothetical protein [Caudoviricetes sp.]
MESSTELSNIIKRFKQDFSENWIENLIWDNDINSKNSHGIGLTKIQEFINFIFTELSKAILEGKFLYQSYDSAQTFCEELMDESDIENKNPFKNDLQNQFQDLKNNLQNVLQYFRLNISVINNKIALEKPDYLINAISTKEAHENGTLFELLCRIIDICMHEYELSYEDGYIRNLILFRKTLSRVKQNDPNVQKVLDSVSQKISFLLYKLSHFSQNKSIKFALDFQAQAITPQTDVIFYPYFGYFLNPQSIPAKEISDWQEKCSKNKAETWQMVLLMRYYSKVTKSQKQVDNLLSHYEDFYKKKNKTPLLPFDKYALKTIKNYMYNCKLSLLINEKNCTYEAVIQLLDEITNVQTETSIQNFYPYKKVISFLLDHIKTCIKKENDIQDIENKKSYLDTLIPKLEEAYKWCKNYQFYPFQLMKRDCTIPIKELNIILFSPSTFSRPIKYDELLDQINDCKADSTALDIEIQMYKERQNLLDIKKEINASRKTYIEILGIFSGIITFLFGSIQLFGRADISYTQSLTNILALGLVLCIFIALITITISLEKKYRLWIACIVVLAIVFLLSLMSLFNSIY